MNIYVDFKSADVSTPCYSLFMAYSMNTIGSEV